MKPFKRRTFIASVLSTSASVLLFPTQVFAQNGGQQVENKSEPVLNNVHSDEEVLVACCQINPKVGEIEYNRKIAAKAIRDAAKKNAQVIVLPELAQSGYVFKDTPEAWLVAETQEGKTIQQWVGLAKELNVVIVAGFCEKLDKQQVANSAVLIDPTGVRAVYRKAHLWDNEKNIFVRGNQPPPVVQTAFGRIAVVICYDLEFPEWIRILALKQADLLCAPVNWPDAPRPVAERPAEIIRVQANASVNRLYIAACDRYGIERGVDWVGGSVIVDANGFPLASAFGKKDRQMILAKININEARNKWISKHNHVQTDRLPELY